MTDHYIVGVDGIDGSGKTSLLTALSLDASLRDKTILTTRRSPPSPYVDRMYAVMPTFADSFDALWLFVKDMEFRFSHMPLGRVVLSDRTFLSTCIFYDSISEMSSIEDKALSSRIASLSEEYRPRLRVILLSTVARAQRRIAASRTSFAPVEDESFQIHCARRFAAVPHSDKVLVIDTNERAEAEVYRAVRHRVIALCSRLLQ